MTCIDLKMDWSIMPDFGGSAIDTGRQIIFSQLMEFLPWRRFDTCVRQNRGDYKIKTCPCNELLRVMAFTQLTYR